MNVKDFLKVVSESVQRLNEIQPAISDVAVKDYVQKFKTYIEGGTIAIPEQANGLVNIAIYKEPELDYEAPPSLDVPAPSESFEVTKPPAKKAIFKV